MYTWGYIKDVTLAKLDLDEFEASEQNLTGRFPFYANEAMTQICSTIKPKRTFAEFVIRDYDVGVQKQMPIDFIRFGDDVNTVKIVASDGEVILNCNDEDFTYKGYNKLIFWKPGIYSISYHARWYKFDKSIDNDEELDIPDDILDCLPSYIASQCYKVDDETKSAIFRNEFEIAMARIDDSDYKQTSTIAIGGDW